jgi:hypothetical protein
VEALAGATEEEGLSHGVLSAPKEANSVCSRSNAHANPSRTRMAPRSSPDARQMATIRPYRSRSFSWQTIERPAVSACSLSRPIRRPAAGHGMSELAQANRRHSLEGKMIIHFRAERQLPLPV